MEKTFYLRDTSAEQVKTALMSIAPYIADDYPTWSERSRTFEMSGMKNDCNYTLVVSLQQQHEVDTAGEIDFTFSYVGPVTLDKRQFTQSFCHNLRNAIIQQVDGNLSPEVAKNIEVGRMHNAEKYMWLILIVVIIAVFAIYKAVS
ncbi:MAG: hypothetical protein EOO97_00085 [Pedobacter sp.]|nr:MAG: hypothetical protein EOO97_00085 [Pedobacter sp.]